MDHLHSNGVKADPPTALGRYFLDHAHVLQTVGGGLYGPFDTSGVPMVDYDKAFRSHWWLGGGGRRYGIHYTPVTTAQLAFALYERVVDGDDAGAAERFLAQTAWLRDSLTRMPAGFGLWLHTFPQPSYGLQAPWASAMAQGQGISALLRAYEYTRDEQYLEAAAAAAKAYDYDVSVGGVAYRDATGSLWFEEYPSTPTSHVLNGFMFALWGLLEFSRISGDNHVRDLWEDGVETLTRNLPRYDRNGWSRYDLIREERASMEYHMTHVSQLEVMSTLTGERLFEEVALTWRRNAERANGKMLSAERLVRGVLRRLHILPRPRVQGAVGHSDAICLAVPHWGGGQPGCTRPGFTG